MKICSLVIALATCLVFASSAAQGVEIERTDFKFTAPAGVKAGEESGVDTEADKYRQTNVDLPNGSGVIILAYPDKAAAEKEAARFVKLYETELLKNAKESPCKLFDKVGGKGTLLIGKFLGFDTYFEVGTFSGKKKTIVIICSNLEEEREADEKVVRQILDSFKIKE